MLIDAYTDICLLGLEASRAYFALVTGVPDISVPQCIRPAGTLVVRPMREDVKARCISACRAICGGRARLCTRPRHQSMTACMQNQEVEDGSIGEEETPLVDVDHRLWC